MAARSTKLVALAVATGTVIVAGSLPATAASNDTVAKTYKGATDGFAINLALNLPALTINETVATAQGLVTKTESATAPLTGTATSSLFKSTGATAALFDALNKTATATLGGTLSATADLIPATDALGLVHVAVGNVVSKIVPATVDSVTQSITSSKVTGLNVGLGGALAAPITSATSAVTGILNTAVGTLVGDGTTSNTGLIGQVLKPVTDQLVSITAGTPLATVVSTLQGLPAQLAQLVQDLTASINNITSDQGLLHIGLIGTDQVVKPNGKGLTAVTTSQLGDISVLGGLVGIDALKSIATASANGTKGGALADIAKTSLAHVKIGSLADVQANVDKIEATVAGLGLDQVNAALGLPSTSTVLNDLLTQLQGLLAQAGVQVGYIPGDVKTASADGTSAVASTGGIGIKIGVPAALGSALSSVTSAVGSVVPVDLTKPLLSLQFVPASASVQQVNVDAAPQKATAAKVAAPAGPTPAKKLAYTGASLPLTVGVASVLLVGAAAATRRRRNSEI